LSDDAAYLRNVCDLLSEIDELLISVDKPTFLGTDLIRSAVLLKLIFIGEATRHVSEALRERYPSVPWGDIVGFRNVAVHQYLEIDWERVWTTATSDAPA
jgi:uncharacterized protein with HEPN domain